MIFEEWDDPLISCIGWVSELVEIAGGVDIFADGGRLGIRSWRQTRWEEVSARAG